MKKKKKNLKGRSEPRSDAAALFHLLCDSVQKKPSGIFILLPFRIFEMLRLPKGKRFISPQISDDQFFALLPERASDQLHDLMELENPEDRLCVFRDLGMRSEMAVEIQKSLRVQELVAQFGFKQRGAERVTGIGGELALEAVRWLSGILHLPDPRTRKMLLFLLQPAKGGKLKRKEIIDRLEFTKLPVPHARSSEDFVKIILTAYEAMKLGFPFKKSEKA